MLDVTLLAILQGIAEFLPVSSSGHLVVAQHFMGMNAPGMRLDVFLHVGTLLSIFAFYRRAIVRLATTDFKGTCGRLFLSALPAVVAYALFGQAIKGVFETPSFVGGLFIVTGLLLLLTRFLPAGDRAVTAKRAFIMGLGQALALLPGISRSGTTLVCARACRVAPEKAAEFSFLMSAPLILGAVLLETLEAFSAEAAASASPSWPLTVYGSLLAAVVGYFSLSLLVRALKGAWFWLFGPYCLAVGVLTLLLA